MKKIVSIFLFQFVHSSFVQCNTFNIFWYLAQILPPQINQWNLYIKTTNVNDTKPEMV